jgi:type I restriction enzyme M protein
MKRSQSRALVNVGEIAALAGVRPSAVSNWRRRKLDFPGEVEDGLFDRSEVERWLRKEGKPLVAAETPSDEGQVWLWARRLRGVLAVEEIPWPLLQLLALRAASTRSIDRLSLLSDAWAGLVNEDARLSWILTEWPTDRLTPDPELSRAMRPSTAFESIDLDTLDELIGLFDGLDDNTDWGLLASGILKGFTRDYARKGGEFSTAPALAGLIVGLLEPLQGVVYDPACGAGLVLAEAWKRGGQRISKLLGQEVNEQSWRLAFLHLVLNQAPVELVTGDTLHDDGFWSATMDRIAADPPLNMLLRDRGPIEADPRWRFGVPPAQSDLLWVQHVLSHLSEDGFGVVVVAPDTLIREGPEEKIRLDLVRSGVVDAVIQLPPGLSASTQLPIALIVLERSRGDRADAVLFIDARQLGVPERGGLRRIDHAEINRIVSALSRWRTRAFEPEPGFTGVATLMEIEKSRASLTPARYVSYKRRVTEIDGEPIEARLSRLRESATVAGITARDALEELGRTLSSIEVPNGRK